MLEEAVSRLIEGFLSGIGIGFIFYLFPVFRHTFSQKYRFKFRFNEDGNIEFRKERLINERNRFKDEIEIKNHINLIKEEINVSDKNSRMIELRNWLNFIKN